MQGNNYNIETLECNLKNNVAIEIDHIQPFYNRCKVLGILDTCNISITYVPDKHIIETSSLRHYFDQEFNSLVEEIADDIFTLLMKILNPKYLKVRVYLAAQPDYTHWSVTIESDKQ